MVFTNMTEEEDLKINKRIGERLRIVRQVKGFSLKEIGKILGMTGQQVQKYEAGKNRISIGKLMIISETLNVPLSFFLNEEYKLKFEV
jgi:transcriptional regulator with XRE-family HTH domain